MKDLEVKMLSELLKNSKRSDRELALAIGTSQPTATRLRRKLEQEGYIKEYTAIPNLAKAGYTVMAMTFIRLDHKSLSPREPLELNQAHFKAMEQIPGSAVFLAKQGLGLGYDGMIISFHTNFDTFDRFQLHVKKQMSEHIVDVTSFLANIGDDKNALPLTFKVIAGNILMSKEGLPEKPEPEL